VPPREINLFQFVFSFLICVALLGCDFEDARKYGLRIVDEMDSDRETLANIGL
jgi:hypothetical protein